MALGLKDRVILVTGAAGGLGLAYSKGLVAQGAIVAMQDGGVNAHGLNPDSEVIKRAARNLTTNRVFPIAGLLDSKDQCERVVSQVIDKFGKIDGLVANAGTVLWRDTVGVDEIEFRQSSAINHEASFWLCKAALPHMRDAGFGRIVLTSSGWALAPYPGSDKLTLYCQSKGAQFGLGMALGLGAGHPNIRTNVVAPVANTRVYASKVEEGRLKPESVAGTVSWLVSPQCDITGRVLKVADGNVSILEVIEKGTATLGDEAENPEECGKAIKNMIEAG